VKIRELLRWFNDALRPVHTANASGEGMRPNNDDALVPPAESAPLGWVPSQQDEGPTNDGGVL
jgi:hypothetical protein